MNGLVLEEINDWPRYRPCTLREPTNSEVIVNLHASSLNHRDVWISKGMYPGITLPMVLGSDGAGTFGDQEVVINPNINWGSDEGFQSADYQVLGLPTSGTFCSQIIVDKNRLQAKPDHLSIIEAAALPLTGLTAYRALFTKGNVTAKSRVLIHGIGGGVALMAFQMALAKGAKVFVSSSSTDKLTRAKSMGAHGGINYKDMSWIKRLQKMSGGIDVVIDGAGGDGVGALLSVCNPGAHYVIYGGSTGKMNNMSPQLIFWKQISILGSTMGSDQEFIKMLDFVNEHKIIPVIDEIIPLSEGHFGFEKMAAGRQFGKIVFNNRS